MRRVAVAIMAKAPVAGAVKTRLMPPLTAAEAAHLYRAFLLDKIEQVRALEDAHAVVAYTPLEASGVFEELAPGFELLPQRGPELGARLANGLAELLAHGHAAAVAIDSDTPTLPTAFLQQGVDILLRGDADVVVGPCDDGGYYLIGARAERPELFENMPWSTPGVLFETLRRARAAGLTTACLPEWFDVDTAADLERLRASLTAPGATIARHTARFFAERGR
ncbi:MAG: TIGR04282 family arsenosugar biosynthesis glycosyltransferase [Candidatus Rokuibacteriota bacterium]